MSTGTQGANILIVDDDKAIRGFLRGRLESQSWVVHEASDGAKALQVLATEAIELIITDLRMPTLGGLDLMAGLRQVGDARPIIVLTGQGDRADVIQALRHGAVDFIDKPFQFETLRVAVESALTHRQAAPGSPTNVAAPTAAQATEPDKAPLPASPAATATAPKAQSLIEAIRERLAQGSVNLPVMGPVVQDLKALMDDPNRELAQVAAVVETDQEIVGRIIAMANSGAFGGRSTATNVRDAISRMGMRAVFSAAVQCVTSRMRQGIEDPRLEQLGESLFMRTIDTAKAGRALARSGKDRQPDDVYTLALLADVGELFLLRVIDQVLPTLGARPNTEAVGQEIERYHVEFGAAMLTRWGFDGDPVIAARAHHDAKRVDAASTTNPRLGRRLRFLAVARYAVAQVTGVEASERSNLGPLASVLAAAELDQTAYDEAVAALGDDKARDAGEEQQAA